MLLPVGRPNADWLERRMLVPILSELHWCHQILYAILYAVWRCCQNDVTKQKQHKDLDCMPTASLHAYVIKKRKAGPGCCSYHYKYLLHHSALSSDNVMELLMCLLCILLISILSAIINSFWILLRQYFFSRPPGRQTVRFYYCQTPVLG